jgi:glycosyltransferase involved in cell wall biosynthesis
MSIHSPSDSLPLVSVLIPAYNTGRYLRAALNSILSQSYKNLEIIIIDDGSTDGSIASISDLIDTRTIVIKQKNSGKAAAVNKALDVVLGDYWMIQDGDDLSHLDRVSVLLNHLILHPDLAAAYTGHDLLLNDKQFAPTFTPLSQEECRSEVNNFRIPAHDATGMYRTALTKNIKFDEELRIGQGIDYVLKVGERYLIEKIGCCKYSYRINYDSTTRKHKDNYLWIQRVLEKAYLRRGFDISCLAADIKNKNKSESGMNYDIVPHCMNSVVDLKKARRLGEAISVALSSAILEPRSLLFYKPLLYALLPSSVISAYRLRKRVQSENV